MKALVIGYGSIGKRHIENLAKFDDIQIIVITKRPEDNFLKHNHCKLFKSVKESLSEKPDFAIISTESSFHVKDAIILAKNKIHFFIEKPISNSMRGIDTLMNETTKNRLVSQVGCNLRFHPCIQKIKNDILPKKKLGD